MKLEDLIAECVAAKTGNKEFALHYYPSAGLWRAGIGNPTHSPLVGCSAEVNGEGKSAEEAVRALLQELGSL